LEDTGVDTFFGPARFTGPHTIRVGDQSGKELRDEYLLIATGSSPPRPPEFPFDDERVHDSDQILELRLCRELWR
jgi:NAD(P) transhydrogenase